MRKLNKDAFVVMGMCSKNKLPFGITVDKNPEMNSYDFVWSFKINADKARREGYGSKKVRGSIAFDPEYPGCPYCGESGFYICSSCGTIVCWHGDTKVTCPKCGKSATVTEAEEFDLKGGGY